MKNLLCAVMLVVLAWPLFADQTSAPAPAPSELLKLRQDYLASLNALLQQYEKDSNSTDAAAVKLEILKVTPPTIPAPSDGPSPVGAWAWHHNATVVAINADGSVGKDHKQGAWHWLDQENRTVEIDWSNSYIDKLTIATDGKTLRVVNNLGEVFTARLVPPTNDHEPPKQK